jgi:hypothetical protein
MNSHVQLQFHSTAGTAEPGNGYDQQYSSKVIPNAKMPFMNKCSGKNAADAM